MLPGFIAYVFKAGSSYQRLRSTMLWQGRKGANEEHLHN
jgi:hypothetical protein